MLTHGSQWSAPEELIELGEVHDHAELVGLLSRRHLFASSHRQDPKLTLGHVKCQLIVLHSVILIQRVKVAGGPIPGELRVRQDALSPEGAPWAYDFPASLSPNLKPRNMPCP